MLAPFDFGKREASFQQVSFRLNLSLAETFGCAHPSAQRFVGHRIAVKRTVQNLDLRIRNARSQQRERTIACGNGLLVRVMPQGTKIFTLRYRPMVAAGEKATQRRITLGRYPDMTLADARTAAERMRSEVRNGRDPSVEINRKKRATDAPGTVDELVTRFLTGHVRLKNKASTAAETQRLLATYLQPKIGKRRLQDVQRSDLTSLIRKEAERILAARKGARGTAANRIKAAASKLFAFAVSEGWLELNPASGIPPLVNEKPRERTLTDQEIGQLWNALLPLIHPAAHAPVTHRVVALLLLTGARASEIATLRLRHFAPDASTLAFEEAKNKASDRALPLSGAALATLLPAVDIAKQGKPDSFIFPAVTETGRRGRKITRAGHLHRESVTRAGARLAVDLGHEEPQRWTIHDLRRTFITWAHELGYEPELVRRVTGHAARDVHGRVYDRSKRMEAMRQLLNDWAAHVADCGAKEAGQDASNVVRLSAR